MTPAWLKMTKPTSFANVWAIGPGIPSRYTPFAFLSKLKISRNGKRKNEAVVNFLTISGVMGPNDFLHQRETETMRVGSQVKNAKEGERTEGWRKRTKQL